MARKVCIIVFFIVFLLLFSCGLDVYYFVEPPFNSSVIVNPSDPSEQYFSFTAADASNSEISAGGNVNFLGTDVYYKIYSDLSTLQSQRNSINSSNTEYTENGINRLNNLGFQKISSSNYSDPLIKKATSNQSVSIRLFYSDPYDAEILVNQNDIGKPLRYNGESFEIPAGTILQGLDVNTTNLDESSPSYYVLLYAVSVSTLNLSQRIYSSLCPLGYLQLL